MYAEPVRAVGYVRVSTDEQADNGVGLDVQRLGIETEAGRRGWELVGIEEDAASGKSMARPGLRATLKASGMSLAGIANELNERGVPTAQGGVKWYPSSVRAVLMAEPAATSMGT